MSDSFLGSGFPDGGTLTSGKEIMLKWNASRPMNTLSFKLCRFHGSFPFKRSTDQSSAVCGPAVWKIVEHSSDGVDSVSFKFNVLNDADGPGAFFLRIEDDDGFTFDSPNLTWTPPPVSPSPDFVGVTAPGGSYAETPPPTSSMSEDTSYPEDFTGSMPSRVIRSVNSSMSASNQYPNHPTIHPASFAVPLVLVGCILAIALWLTVRNWRKRSKCRIRDAEKWEDSLNLRPDQFIGVENERCGVELMPTTPAARRSRKSVPVSLTYTNATPTIKKPAKAFSVCSSHSQTSVCPPSLAPVSLSSLDKNRQNFQSKAAENDRQSSPDSISSLRHTTVDHSLS